MNSQRWDESRLRGGGAQVGAGRAEVVIIRSKVKSPFSHYSALIVQLPNTGALQETDFLHRASSNWL